MAQRMFNIKCGKRDAVAGHDAQFAAHEPRVITCYPIQQYSPSETAFPAKVVFLQIFVIKQMQARSWRVYAGVHSAISAFLGHARR